MFMVSSGERQLLDVEGQVVATENWRTAIERYLGYCRDNDIEPLDMAGPNT
jgi:2,4'-dihydroxyacetophenone dioxygenase